MKTDDKLLEIARKHLSRDIEVLETRGRDSLDFFEVSVWGVHEALKAAYEAGRESAKKGSK